MAAFRIGLPLRRHRIQPGTFGATRANVPVINEAGWATRRALTAGEARAMDSGHTLLVLRHAKAAGEPGINDIERPLTGRGRRNATAVGQWLLAQGLVPDWVLCSSSRRTRETWERVSAALGAAAPGEDAVMFEPRVYDAGAQDLLDLVNEQPDGARTVLTVGHNPASQQLVALLTGRSGMEFPTCAVAVIRLGGRWAAVAPGGGELAGLWTPRSPG
jgi:phosphohistidine phosphatase